MIQYFIGLLIGVASGIAIGFYIGKGKRKWSELTAKDRKVSVISVSSGIIMLLVGIAVLIIMVAD